MNKLEAMDTECFDEEFEFPENTLKHLADRYPLHYQSVFAFVESKKQETAN